MKYLFYQSKTFLILFFVTAIFSLKSQTISVSVTTAGTLSSYIASSKKDLVEDLKISGYLNGTDINFLSGMAKLNKLDLSDVYIRAGGNAYYSYQVFYAYCLDCSPQTNVWKSTPVYTEQNKITDYLFRNFTKLTSIIIPNSVNSIGDCVLSGCSNLTSVTIGSNVSSISAETDWNGKTTNGWYTFGGCPNLKEVNVASGNSNFTSVDGVVYTKNLTKLVFYPPVKSTIAVIPKSVNSLGSRAFGSSANLSIMYCLNSTPAIVGTDAFKNVNKAICKVYVPKGSYSSYWIAGEWGDFTNIIEMKDFVLSSNVVNIAATEGSTASVEITTTTSWVASSDQTWLTINPSGTGNGALRLTAEANMGAQRTAIVTVTPTDAAPQAITVVQFGVQSSVDEIQKDAISLYPNPITEDFRVNGINGIASLKLFDLNGRLLLAKQITNNESVSISTLHKGIYILKLITQEGAAERKIIKE